jgi:antitoxin component HigA of HigAB toxin-antitoxin module
MFLSGQRSLTIDQVQKLCARFQSTADVLIPRIVAPGLGGD